jgi:NAD(P)-dependent dehydrogenase (short-subunit alcohol dehydrogenase family)
MQLILAFYIFNKFVRGKKPRFQDLTGKVYIVTGANTGIGFETAKALINMNATVIMACRSLERAGEAKTRILRETNCSPTKAIAIKLDLNGFDSVKKFVKVRKVDNVE